jgi:hypothetical protein
MGDLMVESQGSGRSLREAEALKAPLRCERRDAEAFRQLVSVGKRRPRVAHRRLRHEELGAEDVRFALEGAHPASGLDDRRPAPKS